MVIAAYQVTSELVATPCVLSSQQKDAAGPALALDRIHRTAHAGSRHSDAFCLDLQQMINDFNRDADKVEEADKFGAEAATRVSLTADFVSWTLAAGSMTASLLAPMPAWHNLGPVPVLAARSKQDRCPVGAASQASSERVNDDQKIDSIFER